MNSLSFYSSKNRATILGCFFLFFIFEACIGGSGGLIQIRGITIRKINFCIALISSLFLILYFKRIQNNILIIVLLFSISLIIPTILGFINYGLNPKVIENFLMQSFFLLLPFYSLFIKSEKDVRIAGSAIKFASLTMAMVFLAVIILMAVGVLDFLVLYSKIADSQEFTGRGQDLFWFKGFLYLCLGLFFFDNEEGLIFKRIKQFIILIAVYFTFTRGFVLAFFASIFIYQVFFRSFIRGFLIGLFSILLIFIFNGSYTSSSFDRGESDEIRVTQYHQVMSSVTPTSFLFGNGYGEGVAIRDNHMEINYLEIFHKQGLFGLLFWFSLMFYIIFLYLKCNAVGYEKEARPFLLSTLFVYIQSATNPFLTNSIGLNMLMISIVSLNVYVDTASAKKLVPN